MADEEPIPLPQNLEPPPRSTGDAKLDYPILVDWMYVAYQVIVEAVDYINQQVESGDLDVTNLPDPATSNTFLAQETANSAYILADETNDKADANSALITVNISDIATNVADISTNTADILAITTHTPVTVSDTTTVDITLVGQAISCDVIQGGLDHGSIGGLTDDDHAIYALLSGRAGGQTFIGGASSGNNLTIQSTSHATKGKILFGTSAYDEVNNRLGLGTSSPTETLDINNDTIRVRTSKTPSSASDTGTQGQIAWDSGFLYICTATNTWRRVAHVTW